MEPNNEETRVRAWVLIQAEDPGTVVNDLFLLDKGLDELVVIRADEVDGGPANIVAAIDSAEGYYNQTVADIRAINGITNLWFLQVVVPNPEPPNNASGFVTTDELNRSTSKLAYRGRQDQSPGYNPWG